MFLVHRILYEVIMKGESRRIAENENVSGLEVLS
jgi:hypothetical protein